MAAESKDILDDIAFKRNTRGYHSSQNNKTLDMG